MTRRGFLKAAGLGAAAMAMPSGAPAGDAARRRPNVLFLFSDQQRWDTVECYGRPIFRGLTPNLDRMAAEGVRFQHAFTCQPVCGPARAALQTGKYATATTCFRNGIALPRDERTMAHLLSEAGYDVGYIGKWHLASDDKAMPGVEAFNCRTKPVPPERRGGYKDFWLASDVLEFTSHGHDGHMFDAQGQQRNFPEGRYRVDAQTDWVLEYLRSRKPGGGADRPFFLFVSYIEPHHQNDHRHFEGPHGSRERFGDFRVPGDLEGTGGDWKQEMPDYLGCCGSLDENVGRIRDELRRLGLADNTLVIYTSDHGCHFRTRNSEYKRSCHDNSIRIPLIACGPGFAGGRVVDRLVSLIDLTPTVLAAGGVALPGHLHGRARQGLVDGTAADWPQEVFVQISESCCGRAVRTERWKYSVVAPKGSAASGGRDSDLYVEEFLYDLEKDPHERDNLVADGAHAEVRAGLAAALKRRMLAAGEKEPLVRPPA